MGYGYYRSQARVQFLTIYLNYSLLEHVGASSGDVLSGIIEI